MNQDLANVILYQATLAESGDGVAWAQLVLKAEQLNYDTTLAGVLSMKRDAVAFLDSAR